MNSSTRGTRVHAQAASQTHALCINDLAASGVIESSPAHLEGGEIGPSILETARLKNGFDRKREYTYIDIVEALNITWFHHQS